MARTKSYDVFISYASAELDLAERLRERLATALGVPAKRLFLARSTIGASADGHDDWLRSITQASMDSKAFLIVATPGYLTRDWCKYEATLRSTGLVTASSRRSTARRSPQWFPVSIYERDRDQATRSFGGDELGKLPLGSLLRARWYHARDPAEMSRLVAALREVVGRPPHRDADAAGRSVADAMESAVAARQTPSGVLAGLIDDLRDSAALDAVAVPREFADQYCVDGVVTLAVCGGGADRLQGTAPAAVRMRLDRRRPFRVAAADAAAYRRFFAAQAAKDPGRYWDLRGKGDGRKAMLSQLPLVASDHVESGGRVQLDVRPVKYSQVLFHNRRFFADARSRTRAVRLIADERTIAFANILCMHVVVLTSDEKVVVVRRAATVHFYPGKYAASIEEQVHPKKDLGAETSAFSKWMRRALEEELSLVADEHYREKDARLLSVFLEHTIMNVGVLVVAPIRLTEHEMRRHLSTFARKDYEFDLTLFYSWDRLLSELVSPTLVHHPTSRYRMLMALLHCKGANWMATALAGMRRAR